MSCNGKILIVDDDALVLEVLNKIFTEEYEVLLASTGKEAIEIVDDTPDLDAIILDIKMARMDGLQTATAIKDISPEVPIIFHTGYPGEFSEEEIEKEYQPFDYIGKDERPARLHRAVKQAVTFYRLKQQSVNLINHAREHFEMVGRSKDMLKVYQTIEKIATTDRKVIIYGPTGSGKELVARALHRMSKRSEKRLVICNCNHRSSEMVEAELFGHLRGSFTGAITDRVGLLEYADGGTLFLDEVGDLDIETQVKLLRVLESGEMHRIGSPEMMTVDVRVICATHRDLKTLVDSGTFREDLYYRLKGVTIVLPPLRERPEDILALVDHFIDRHCNNEGIGPKIFEPAARNLLVEFDWPGNVRQLMDTVQSLIDLSPSHFITAEDVTRYLSLDGYGSNGEQKSLKSLMRDYKKRVLIEAMDRHNNNVSAAARELDVDASNLGKTIKDLGISKG